MILCGGVRERRSEQQSGDTGGLVRMEQRRLRSMYS
jgi:hypothetical protein